MGLAISCIIHGWGLWDCWALVCMVLECAGAVVAGTLFHIPFVCVYIYIYLYPPVYLPLYLCTEVYHVYLSLKIYIQRDISAGFTLDFLGLEVKYVKKQWQRKQGVKKMSNDNVDWFIWILEVSLCCVISGTGAGAEQEFFGAIKSRTVRWAHMVSQPGLML